MARLLRRLDAPDIRWSTLREPDMEHGDGGESHPPVDRESLARAVKEGVGPGGHGLDTTMTRWGLDERQMDALIEYLKEL